MKANVARIFWTAPALSACTCFRNRLPMMHRDGWTGNRVSNPTAFGWFVWQRDYTGKTEFDRISWNRGIFESGAPRDPWKVEAEMRRLAEGQT